MVRDGPGIVDRDGGARKRRRPKEKPKPPTRLVLVRHAVTAQTGPLLSGRMPGIDLSEKGIGQAEATAQRLAKLADRRGVREPDRTHDADRAAHRRARTVSKCSRSPA